MRGKADSTVQDSTICFCFGQAAAFFCRGTSSPLMCRTLSARSTIHPWSSRKSNPKMHLSWMSAIHMGCTTSCDPIFTWRSPFPCMGRLFSCNSSNRLAHRLDVCLLLLRQNIRSDDGNISSSINGDSARVFLHTSSNK